MELALNRDNIVFNKGFIETMRHLSNAYLRYKDKDTKYVQSYLDKETIYIKTTKSETEFSININGMDNCFIKVTNGYIGAKAVAIKKSKLFAKTGAIELRIKKEEIGELYLKVDSGMIIDNSDLIAITSLGETGFEGIFNGSLSNQKTELLVNAGAIVCTIY